MEAGAYLSISKNDRKPKARLTLSRHQPGGGLFGPLDATLVSVGNIGLPPLENVLRGGSGNGLVLSNRPLDQPTSYGMQTLRGELPQGWDATLYFNDAVIAFAQSRSDGLYEFPDLPLAFGRNEFRVVLHGPLGQTRIERQAYQLDQMVTKPGRFYYIVAGQREDRGGAIRQTAQLDLGLFKNAAATLGEVYIDKHDGTTARIYLHAGVRAAALGSLINVDRTQELGGGALTQVGLRTRFLGISVDANRLWLSDFQSDAYAASEDPLRSQERVRLIGAVPLGGSRKLPFAIDVTHARTRSGVQTFAVSQRLSVNMLCTSLTNSIDWSRAGGADSVGGALQLSRWIAGTGLSGQLAYTIFPVRKLGSLAVTADKSLSENNRVRLGLLHDFISKENTATFGLNRNLGRFGVGVSGRFSGLGNLGFGLQFFTSLGRDPRSGRIMQDWRPTAGLGQVSAHVFVDGNQNGTYDKGEENVAKAGFTVNGGNRQQASTDDHGIALLNQLQTSVYADIALEQGTLEDPQWLPEKPGLRVLPRPGRVRVVDLPVVLTAEIDGIVYLSEHGAKRGIGDARLELVDAGGKVVGTSHSASDGYYIMPSVRPGHYRLRVAHEQLKGLNLLADREPEITINAKADFVNGIDITVMAIGSGSAAAPSPAPAP